MKENNLFSISTNASHSLKAKQYIVVDSTAMELRKARK